MGNANISHIALTLLIWSWRDRIVLWNLFTFALLSGERSCSVERANMAMFMRAVSITGMASGSVG